MAHIAKLGAQTDEFISAFTGWPTQVCPCPQTLTVAAPAVFSLVPGNQRWDIVEIQILILHLEQIYKVQCEQRCSS